MNLEGGLPEPIPLAPAMPVDFVHWIRDLPLQPYRIPESAKPEDIFTVLRRRRSSRKFGSLPSDHLSELLFHSAKTLEVKRREAPPDWEHKPLPASGGCHAVQILVVPPASANYPSGVYDSRAHGCRVIQNWEARDRAHQTVGEMRIKGNPTLLSFFVDPARIAGFYLNWESLVWRDSGVLIGGMSLVAAALNMKFCPLGFSGTSIVRNFLPIPNVIGVGGCVVGT